MSGEMRHLLHCKRSIEAIYWSGKFLIWAILGLSQNLKNVCVLSFLVEENAQIAESPNADKERV